MKSISLYCQEGSSNKEYHVSISEAANGFVVNFAYARIGDTLKTGTKTQEPVSAEAAQKIFTKIVNEKIAKGYKPDSVATQSEMTHQAKERTGINCQLLNPIEESEVLHYINDDRYLAEEKKDGERKMLNLDGERGSFKLEAINKLGFSTGYPTLFKSLEKSSKVNFLVDGELVFDTLFLFDLLNFNGVDLRNRSAVDRLAILENNFGMISNGISQIKPVYTAYTREEKLALLITLKERNAEGIVFKLKSGEYKSGRPASGGDNLKFKFQETASFIVHLINDKRSVAIGLFDTDGTFMSAGNVTIPPNHDIPKVGDVVEVRYLYAYKESGSVFQPVYKGKRNDVEKHECEASQLKYKTEDPELSCAA
ncbi:MAG: WGR domain-containing protein [Cytophagales bacterium]|nr:WGR domain-containing protein [Cytophagales bacterium]MCA6382301.1 WGR domain-containing protein [Cytophagales bacterium]